MGCCVFGFVSVSFGSPVFGWFFCREAKGKPKANQRQTKGKPKGNQRETKGKTKGKQRETKGKPKKGTYLSWSANPGYNISFAFGGRVTGWGMMLKRRAQTDGPCSLGLCRFSSFAKCQASRLAVFHWSNITLLHLFTSWFWGHRRGSKAPPFEVNTQQS